MLHSKMGNLRDRNLRDTLLNSRNLRDTLLNSAPAPVQKTAMHTSIRGYGYLITEIHLQTLKISASAAAT